MICDYCRHCYHETKCPLGIIGLFLAILRMRGSR